jgi:two-component system, NtrC family, sensor histidine kinase HydH
MANPSTSAVSKGPVETRPAPYAPGEIGGESTEAKGLRADSPAGDNRAAAAGLDLGPEQAVTQRLRAQYAEISQLAGGLAHEIRNPLSTLSLNLDLLLEDFQNAETPRDRRVLQRLERLRPEVHRLHGILESFLRFARVQELKLEPTNLNSVIDELCDFYEPHAATKGIVVRTRFAQDLPLCLLDGELFKQAALNLVLNAEHAMPSGGELILTTRRQGPWVMLEVIDTGVGMAEEVRARIFDAFFSTRTGGSGLGLPTSRKIIEAHGGSIDVQSERGKGSQFSVRLPALEAGVAVAPEIGAPGKDALPRPGLQSL